MKNLIIRQMLPEDVPAALIIERSSFSTPWSETSFLTEVRSASSIALLAEIDGTGVGYIIVKTVADECHLYDLAVQGTHRRKGIAKALLESILAIISPGETRFFFLEVRASNLPALALYRSFGFLEYARRRAYYDHPVEDAVLMRLDLPGRQAAS